jgi:hypothetical protein
LLVAAGPAAGAPPKAAGAKASSAKGASSSGELAKPAPAEPSVMEEAGAEQLGTIEPDASPTALRGHAGVNDDSWKTAVPPDQQELARAHFRDGNALVKESLFVQAVEKYEAALSIWDHPAIHYNLALALLNLDQPLRLRQHLIASLKYGEASLGMDKSKRAEQYLTLVEKQLTWLGVKSEQKGVRVELDGKLLFVGPGSYEDYAEPGEHTVRATQSGFEPTVRPVKLVAGERLEMNMKVYTAEDWIRYRRRWSTTGPIVVTAVGGAVLAAGGVLLWQGIEQIDRFDASVEECGAGGCEPGEVDGSAETGEALQIAGIAALGAGGATMLTGGVLLYMNRRIAYRVDPELDAGASEKTASLRLTPRFSSSFAGLVAQGTF